MVVVGVAGVLNPFLFDQLFLDLKRHLLVDPLCVVGQVIFGDERVKFCFILQGARAHELEGVCVAEVWQDFFWGFRASVTRQTLSHNKPRSML